MVDICPSQRFALRLTQLDLTVAEVARRASLKPNALYNFRSGRTNTLAVRSAIRLAAALRMPVEDLFSEDDEPQVKRLSEGAA
jgi:transcriptional regulator with XRE-family HTH domain